MFQAKMLLVNQFLFDSEGLCAMCTSLIRVAYSDIKGILDRSGENPKTRVK